VPRAGDDDDDAVAWARRAARQGALNAMKRVRGGASGPRAQARSVSRASRGPISARPCGAARSYFCQPARRRWFGVARGRSGWPAWAWQRPSACRTMRRGRGCGSWRGLAADAEAGTIARRLSRSWAVRE
jgi:TPR repeat protein